MLRCSQANKDPTLALTASGYPRELHEDALLA